jgi:NCAIR mutase (PurE)-related protein/chemotaxis protein CheY-P-specific phosphatase CheC
MTASFHAIPEAEIDRLRELAHIGASWAAAALAQLTGRTILKRVPIVSGPERFRRRGQWETGVFCEMEGEVSGLVAVFLSAPTRDAVVSLLCGDDAATAEIRASVLSEFGNILASQTVSAIADTVGGRILPGLPDLVLDDAEAVLESRARPRARRRRGRARVAHVAPQRASATALHRERALRSQPRAPRAARGAAGRGQDRPGRPVEGASLRGPDASGWKRAGAFSQSWPFDRSGRLRYRAAHGDPAVNRARVLELLQAVGRGAVDPEAAVERLARLPFVDVPDARVDTHRALRAGLPEVVFAPGKSEVQIAEIVRTLRGEEQEVLVTRVEPDVATQVCEALDAGEYDPVARTLWFGASVVQRQGKGRIAVISAGTADASVAHEAARVARCFGNEVDTLVDVGVAGLHRLLASSDTLRSARVLIVVAGMEGALPSVVGGLVDKPVIGVPTSVGYGASFGGVAALLGMLTSCASNVTVVNIDNGFGAAYVATLINRL